MAASSRRSFLSAAPALVATAFVKPSQAPSRPHGTFPAHDPDLVREVVGVSHGNFARLRELIDGRPALADAAWDWGFGDWESALGAASHVGNREIANYLIERGAQSTIFSAAMLGHLAVVKALVEIQPGIQRTKGPHSITLMAHAVAGGPSAAPVVEYLKTLGDADDRIVARPLAPADRDRLVGSYAYGDAADERLDIALAKEALNVTRPGRTSRGLVHRGDFEFSPVGAESVRLKFAITATDVTLTVVDGAAVLVASRRPAGLR